MSNAILGEFWTSTGFLIQATQIFMANIPACSWPTISYSSYQNGALLKNLDDILGRLREYSKHNQYHTTSKKRRSIGDKKKHHCSRDLPICPSSEGLERCRLPWNPTSSTLIEKEFFDLLGLGKLTWSFKIFVYCCCTVLMTVTCSLRPSDCFPLGSWCPCGWS